MSTFEKRRLLEITKNDVDKDKDGGNVPKLEPVKVLSVHCNLAENDINTYQKHYLFLFQINNLEMNISPPFSATMNKVNTEFFSVEV